MMNNSISAPNDLTNGRPSRPLARLRTFRAGMVLLIVLAGVAACGGGDDDSPEDSGTPAVSAGTATTAGRSPGATTSSAGTATGETSPTSTEASAGEPTPEVTVTNSGTAIIGGVQYDIAVSGCTVTADSVLVIGGGRAPDGRPFLATVQWSKFDFSGNQEVLEVGIGTDAETLYDFPENVYKLGAQVTGSTVTSLELHREAFSVAIAGKFIDINDSNLSPQDGSFNLSCAPA